MLLLGPPAVSVLIFEVLLNATSMFNHSNVRMPLGFDRVLRWLVVTPDMHRVHHSVYPQETNSNFGFNLPWWDHLMGTYRDQPKDGHASMTIGLRDFRDERVADRLHWMLLLPLIGRSSHYPINRRTGHAPTNNLLIWLMPTCQCNQVASDSLRFTVWSRVLSAGWLINSTAD